MRNINELIGIIKGINFDGVVNDLEVLRLQNWVDQNRNLSYDKQQTVTVIIIYVADQLDNNYYKYFAT